MHSPTCSALKPMLTPSASSTSALPDLEDTARLPCLATRAPAAAQTKVEAVEILKVLAASPPVPTTSTRLEGSLTSTLVASSRITCAAAAISPMVSFFTRRPIKSAAIITGDICPLMIWRMMSSISSWKISRCSMVRVSASCGVMPVSPVFAHLVMRGSCNFYDYAFSGCGLAFKDKKLPGRRWPCPVSMDSG